MNIKNTFVAILLSPIAILTLWQLVPVLLNTSVPQVLFNKLTITQGVVINYDIIIIVIIGIIGYIMSSLYVVMKIYNLGRDESIINFHMVAVTVITLLLALLAILNNSNLILGLFFTIVLYRSGLDAAKTFDFSSAKEQYYQETGQPEPKGPPWFINILGGFFGFLVMGSIAINLQIPSIFDFLQLSLPSFSFPKDVLDQFLALNLSLYLPDTINTGNILVLLSLIYTGFKISFYGSEGFFKPNNVFIKSFIMLIVYSLFVVLNGLFYLFVLSNAELDQYLTIIALIFWSVGYFVQLFASIFSDPE